MLKHLAENALHLIYKIKKVYTTILNLLVNLAYK